ncbi:PREDICTED: uncharacterized protein LOC109588094 isoform X3 [Amphimedon queenslandica]|uniref:ZU5 domain-containing protein n=1 Tax=Amphimedon queenslandica TaxID=400682 RepID=A0AAN0JSP4_AMPQE|nr:PREDICTED: uncharacterized protein LOC109588094 isoform X3 [Amphimedon queenslandica]|eukprot:XP_019859843.1 PREDICTED: uncharacterized protein LOC109588094 isoform X3 [Amphimedon queenslandica]
MASKSIFATLPRPFKDKPSMDKPKRRAHHCAVSVGDSLYVWGGNQNRFAGVHDNEEKRKITSTIQHFTPSTGQWITRDTAGTPPLGVIEYCCTAINDLLYYFGGACGHGNCYHNSITQLDTVSLQWRELEPTDATRPVMRRGYGGMISFKHDGVHHLLMIGGRGSKPAVQLPHYKYIELPHGNWHTNEHSIYNISSKKWSTPLINGQCIPPAESFIIEKINNTRAILFGGVETIDGDEDAITNNIYILEISLGTVVWQCIKKPEAIDQWPVGRYNHGGAIVITGSDFPILVISGGKDKDGHTLDDYWIFNITQHSWIKLDVPKTFSLRYAHSLSSFVLSPHCALIVTVGGRCHDSTAFITKPNIAMLNFIDNKGEWTVGDTLDTNGMNNEEYKKKYQLQYQKPRKGDTADIEQTVQALMKSLEEKEREAQVFHQQMEQKEKEEVEKDQEIRRYCHQLQEKDMELQEKDRELQEKDRELQEKDRELQEAPHSERKKEEMEKKLEDKMLETKKFLEHLQQKDEMISKKIQNYNYELQKMKKELEDKESEIQKLNQLLQNKDKELTKRDQILKKHLTQDELKGVHVAAKNSFLIHSESTQLVNWEEYGIRITIPQGAVLPSDTVQVTITALIGGDFIFPEDTELVSAVYAINTSKPFLEPVKLEIQHCVSIKIPSHCNFSFATAPSDKTPYQFKLVNGGNFVSNGCYGNIYVSEFCLWSLIEYVRTSISFFTNKSYYGQVVREVRRPGREWLIKFLLSKDLNALKKRKMILLSFALISHVLRDGQLHLMTLQQKLVREQLMTMAACLLLTFHNA